MEQQAAWAFQDADGEHKFQPARASVADSEQPAVRLPTRPENSSRPAFVLWALAVEASIEIAQLLPMLFCRTRRSMASVLVKALSDIDQ